MESVDFLAINFNHQSGRVFFFRRDERVFLLSQAGFLPFLLELLHFLGVFDGLVDLGWVSREELIGHLVINVGMLVVESWESLELHTVGLVAPEESLGREFVAVLVSESHSDVVIALLSTDSSPEQKFFEVGVG